MNQSTQQKIRKSLFGMVLLVSLSLVGGAGVLAQTGTQSQTSTSTTDLVSTTESAGLIPCGKTNDDPTTAIDESAPCTACHAVLVGKRAVDFGMRLIVIFGIALITGMGILYIISAGNDGLLKRAKEGIKYTLTGFVLILSSWLMVSVILSLVANENFINGNSDGTKTGFLGLSRGEGAFGLTCNTVSRGNTAKLEAGVPIQISLGGSGTSGSGSVGTGSCSPITTSNNGNPCSVSALQNTCFASKSSTWSAICNVESSGGRPITSKTDVCANLGNKSFSGGIFQINILANGKLLDATRCNDLGKHTQCLKYNGAGACVSWSCTAGSDVANWDYCMGLTLNATTNIQAACKISKNGTYTAPWPHTAQTVCKIPKNI